MITKLYLDQALFLRKSHQNLNSACITSTNKYRHTIGISSGLNVKSVCTARFILSKFLDLDIEKIPQRIHCCHSCNNYKCINPLHLYFGDASENAEDKSVDNLSKGGKSGGRNLYHFIAITPEGTKLECFGLNSLEKDFNLRFNHVYNFMNKGKVIRQVKQKAPKTLGWEFILIDKVYLTTGPQYKIL